MEAGPIASRLQFGDVTLVPEERLVLRNGQSVPLTPKAFDLLLVLAENAGRLLTKEQLLQAVWADTAVEESNLSYHVFAIRKALGDTAENGQLIETVPKRGYRFTAVVSRLNRSEGPSPAVPDPGDLEQAGSVDRVVPGQPLRNSPRWRSAVWFVAGIVSAGGGALLLTMGRSAAPPTLIRATIPPGVQLAQASPFAMSPDGERLVFAGRGQDGVTRLWMRGMGDDTPRPLAGTEAALGGLTPPMFWSPDSQTIAFDGGGQLKRFDLRDGAMRTVCTLPGLAVGGSWNAVGIVIVGQPDRGLLRCSPDGRASELTRVDAGSGETAHAFPWFLPDGRHFLYVRIARNAPEGSGVYLGSLDDGAVTPRPTRLLATGFGAAYVPAKGASAGHVVFLRDVTLFAQRFDERTLQLRGDAVPLASPVGSYLDGGFFAASQSDVIAFRPPDKDFQLTWFDRQGKRIGTIGEVGRYSRLAISPDDARVAAAKELVGVRVDQDVWILDTSRLTSMPATSGPVLEEAPVWSGDGRRFMFTTSGDIGTLYEQEVDGSLGPRLLLGTKLQHKMPTSASRDGRFLLFSEVNMGRSGVDVSVLPLQGDGKPFPLIQRAAQQEQAQFSPDGRWVAYASNESGRYEVLVQRFITPSDATSLEPATVVVSTAGGTAPRWRDADGKELYFIAPDGTVMAAEVRTSGGQLSIGEPQALFRLAGSYGDWDAVSDGSRFLIAIPAGADASAPFTVLWNRLGQRPRAD